MFALGKENYRVNFQTTNPPEISARRSLELPKLARLVTSAPAVNQNDPFEVENLFTMKELFDAGVHLGHKVGSLDQRMNKYIYGSRLDHLIIDLRETEKHLKKALNFTAHIAYRGGIIVFFNRNAMNGHKVEKTAIECKEFSHTRFWRGGVFTNANVQFGTVTRLPDLCIFLNTMNNIMAQHTAVRDCAKMNIPTIGIVDTNCNPSLISYPVPGNDDTPTSIDLYCEVFKQAILKGKAKREEYFKALERENQSLEENSAQISKVQ